MAIFIVLLRAVNVGGTGKLPTTELKAMCVAEGYAKVKTYIASGNVLFECAVQITIQEATLSLISKVVSPN